MQNTDLEFFKEASFAMVNHLGTKGVRVKQSDMLSALAAAFTERNWQVLSTKLKQGEPVLAPPKASAPSSSDTTGITVHSPDPLRATARFVAAERLVLGSGPLVFAEIIDAVANKNVTDRIAPLFDDPHFATIGGAMKLVSARATALIRRLPIPTLGIEVCDAYDIRRASSEAFAELADAFDAKIHPKMIQAFLTRGDDRSDVGFTLVDSRGVQFEDMHGDDIFHNVLSLANEGVAISDTTSAIAIAMCEALVDEYPAVIDYVFKTIFEPMAISCEGTENRDLHPPVR